MIYGRRINIATDFSTRVYYRDTDAGGVVYHGSYLDFLERARTEWLRDLGFEQKDLVDRYKMFFLVRKMKLAYVKAAGLDDTLRVTAQICGLGRAQITMTQNVYRIQEVIMKAEVNLACVDSDRLVPKRLPDVIWKKMKGLLHQKKGGVVR